MRKQEKNNDRTAWTVSILVHALLLIAFIFMVAWREPNPPLPEVGIQINFGTDDTGSGDIQPTTPANEPENEEESNPAPAEEEVVEDQPVEETTVEEVVTEEVIEPVTESLPAEDVPTETLTQEAPSPDVIEEEDVPVSDTIEKEKEVVEKPVEEVKEVEQPATTPVLYEKKDTNTTDGTGETDAEAQQANEGNDEGETGDKGQEDGVLDERSIYKGNQGGGGGAPALNMSGWMWDFTPKPNDKSDENGRITFEVKIDEDGEILSVRTIERSVSAAVEKVYRQEIETLTFTKTSDNRSTAAVSTGTITFVIKSK
jgi:outer membrane biosynthesis protein TonB